MEAVILIGIQGSGKSTFYRERFFDTHVRINLDMLKTGHREKCLIDACLICKQSFVVDKTNASQEERRRYIGAARAAGFTVVGYYLRSSVAECQERNETRPTHQVVPLKGLLGAAGRLERPSRDEGFDRLYYVRVDGAGRFVVEDWKDEV